MKFLNWLLELVMPKAWQARRARRRYDELKAMIVEEHLTGRGGVVVPNKYGMKEVEGLFRPPMYQLARTAKGQLCIFWRKEFMTEEVGPPRAKVPVSADESKVH